MDRVDFIMLALLGIFIIVMLITGGWLSGQIAMANEICKYAGFSNGEYNKPELICTTELKLDINMTTDKATP